ncbi:MAG: hypothetical protein COB67_03085 [SAR324 cluster bacterium]|uniref:DUF402 domain-containing protein n=1 Tax=SAR324 cluster bacterium TaxID=2024889 RepID=A0A2A4TAB3_9DELT|nr:MAG: hypothetical protein COB67_03085 [SAR324 cluster bacterium]
MIKPCKEIKEKLIGDTQTFQCESFHWEQGFGILKFISPSSHQVGSLFLPLGTITYAFYWENRPYNLYKWIYEGREIGNYFNLADSTKLQQDQFNWRDLVIDILITPERLAEILDEDELPLSLDTDLKQYLDRAKQLVLDEYPKIIKETSRLLRAKQKA